MIPILSLVILLVVFALIITKTTGPRITFFLGGLSLIFLSIAHYDFRKLAGKLEDLILPGLIISCSFGFAEILKVEKYSSDTVHLISTGLRHKEGRSRVTYILVALIATFIGSFTLMSANASCGMVAPIFCPILIHLGLSPKLTAAAILGGAWGTIIHPGDINANQINPVLAESYNLPPIDPAYTHFMPALIALIFVAIVLNFDKTGKPVSPRPKTLLVQSPTHKDQYPRALVAFSPFFLLGLYGILARMIHFPFEPAYVVLSAILLCCLLSALMASKHTSQALWPHFLRGGKKGFVEVVLLLVASKIFIDSFVQTFGKPAIANGIMDLGRWQIPLAVFTTFLFAILRGSGDAIITSIVGLVIPFVGAPSATIACSMIWFAGEMGRCASPISAATLTVAGVAGVDPFKAASNALLPIIAGLLAAILALLIGQYGI